MSGSGLTGMSGMLIGGASGAGGGGGAGAGCGAGAGARAGAGAGRYGAGAAGTRTAGGEAGATGAASAAGRTGDVSRSEDGRRSLLTGAVEVAAVDDVDGAVCVDGADDVSPACCTEDMNGPPVAADAVPSVSHATPAPAENPARARPVRAMSGTERANGERVGIMNTPPRVICEGSSRPDSCRAAQLMRRER